MMDARLQKIEFTLDKIHHALFGNGEAGLDEKVRKMERDIYRNPDTGEDGLLVEVRGLRRDVHGFKTSLRTLNWLLGLLGAGGVVALVQDVAARL